MQYCTKCRRVCGDDKPKCPHCHNRRLRPAAPGDQVAFWADDLYTAQRVSEALAEAGIPCQEESAGGGFFSYECTDMPTDKLLLVDFAQLEEAKRVAVAAAKAVEEERGQELEPEEDDPSRAKRLIAETLSILVFLVLVMMAVFGADAAANWLKGFFG